MEALIQVINLKKYFPSDGKTFIRAVDGVSFSIYSGETLGVVGESGCGKSTMARTLIRLYEPDSGEILFNNENIADVSNKELLSLRRNFQIIFQDPYASLNPRMTVGDAVSEPLLIHKNRGSIRITKAEIKEKVAGLFQQVGLSPSFINRYPHEFSGGQRQRVGIARALALQPKLVVCDEPVSALDVSIQAQILNLLEELQEKMGLTYLFISHDLSVVKHLSNRIAVMYLGRIVEISEKNKIYDDPLHPYTKALLSDIPIPDPLKEKTRKRILLKGDLPQPNQEYIGCRFSNRCYLKTDVCDKIDPPLEDKGDGHFSACHHWDRCRESKLK